MVVNSVQHCVGGCKSRRSAGRDGVTSRSDRKMKRWARAAHLIRLAWAPAPRDVAPAIYRPHHYLHFELVPGYRSADGRVSHNSLGFRGPEVTHDKAPGTLRIACLGESTTYCTGLADNETWPQRLQARLAGRLPQPVEVINAGVPGCISSEVLLAYIFKIEALAPDWVIYYFTVNDVNPRQLRSVSRDYREYCRPWGSKPKLSSLNELETFLRHRHTLNYQIRNMFHVDHGEAYILRNTERVFRANLRDLLALASAQSVRALIVLPRYRRLTGSASDLEEPGRSADPKSWAVAQHRATALAIARDHGQCVLDMIDRMPPPPWPDSARDDTGCYLDGIHLTARGADLFAAQVGEALCAQLGEAGEVAG
jgi:lysophospholipase L1-like esterase